MEVFLKVIIVWATYFFIHSFFASLYVKKIFKIYFSGIASYYRLIYNFFATAGLLVIYIYQSSISQNYFYTPNTFITFLGLSLATLGVIVIKDSFAYYNVKEFLGIYQLQGDLEEQDFIRNGLLEYMRHPLYSGSMLLLIGYLIIAPSMINLITVTCMILYFIIGSQLEEKKMIKIFGESYLEYKKQVPRFIPDLQFSRKKPKKGKK